MLSNADQSDWCEALYRQEAHKLVLYGRALGLSHSEAEDVLQETFVALMRRDEPLLQASHYCVRAYRNRALNYRRSLLRRLFRELESKRWFEQQPAETEAEKRAMECLAQLSQDQRETVVLKIWHQYTFQEIGELLDLSPHTVAGRYRYALQKLRNALEGVTYEADNELGTAIDVVETTRTVRKGPSLAL